MGTTDRSGRPYALISTDCHAGADLWDYKPYLEQRWHDEFDAWAGAFSDPWGEVDPDSDYKAGVSSFMSPVSWDSTKRLEMLDAQGVVAEVLFPNTAQPFYPSGSLTAPGPRSRDEYERRWAGVQAHNRWLRDFCDAAPGRRLGLVQLFLDDVDAAIAEVRWAKEAGLKGVLLPPDHHLTIQNLYYAELDPLWAVCAELEMPIHRHATAPSSDEGGPASRAAARVVGVHESYYFGRRALFQLVLAGVFERFPTLKFVLTEVGGSAWVLHELKAMDRLVSGANEDGTINAMFASEAADVLSLTPSEYFRRNCFVSTLLSSGEVAKRHQIGMEQLLWGIDFPHHEGSAPYTVETLRACLWDVPEDDVRQLTSLNAARAYDVDLDQLQAIADRIGPTVAQIATPLSADEVPDDPNFRWLTAAVPTS
ncbi:MAG TPA: amidohydrolase family protein [Acidimicrobiales bacterium]